MKKKLYVGWREWCALPELSIPLIRAKLDTGARTSALHAEQLAVFRRKASLYVRFIIAPLRRYPEIAINCSAKVIDRRYVTDSGGDRELRYVIKAPLYLEKEHWPIEITLTDRTPMKFPMLIGREAMRGRLIVHPGKSFMHGKYTEEEVLKRYASS